MAIDIGTGTTVAFTGSSFSMQIVNVKWNAITRPAIKTSHLGTTTADSFMPGDLYDPGTLGLTCQYDSGVTKPAISGAAENITVTAPDANSAACYGFVTEWGKEYPLEELMMADVTVKFTGPITFTT